MMENRTCPQCRQTLPHDAPSGLCPECLMKVAMGSHPEPGGTVVLDAAKAVGRRLPLADERFGGYRIVRELGHGGMGAVYEAEQVESGRRVALKVLSHQLNSPEARARFLREGRLAASINHPNSVYVFGTEEIDGTPVISMELVAGGTLQERVQRHGPLPPAEAIDAVLQIISGLEAAQGIGILHRDVKPANCFKDADGTVKIGDFGLSISTEARLETNLTSHGAFLGTPAFCSPEQLRGEELSVRSDIYSLGVTLFFLLTGHTPFEGRNMVQLLANVIEQPAPSPRKLRPEVPPDLASAVVRCLAKNPGDRFHGYDELRQALARFSSEAPVPAPLVLRFVAGLVDMALITLVMMPISMSVFGSTILNIDPAAYASKKYFILMASGFASVLLYYSVSEGRWGASAGKAICRLRVAGGNRNAPGIARAALRALVFQLTPVLPYWLMFANNPLGILNVRSDLLRHAATFGYYILLALLFSTARRQNGFASIHDLLSKTRVIRRATRQMRPAFVSPPPPPPKTEAAEMIGPYHVIEPIGATVEGEWMLGYDTRLLRKVWVRVVPPGTPPLRPDLRHVGRVGRLRWISGRRAENENWDAFEGVGGQPLISLTETPQPWSQARFWLLDLATEIATAESDGTMPPVLALDRVWITADGRAKLLDFPAPGVTQGATEEPAYPAPRAVAFLAAVARAVLAGRRAAVSRAIEIPSPLPLHARSFLDRLERMDAMEAVVPALKPLTQRTAAVSRVRRAFAIAGCAAFPLLATASMTFATRLLENWQQAQPDIAQLAQLLNIRADFRRPWSARKQKVSDETIAIYIASHFRATITSSNRWTNFYALTMIPGEKRGFAERAVTEHAGASEKQVEAAEAALKPFLATPAMPPFMREPSFPLLIAGFVLAFYVAIPALIAAFLFRGGLVLLATAMAVVRKDGRRASRLRVLWRSMVAWSPVFGSFVGAALLAPTIGHTTTAVCVATMLALISGVSLLIPGRSLQDRLAGTTLVPR